MAKQRPMIQAVVFDRIARRLGRPFVSSLYQGVEELLSPHRVHACAIDLITYPWRSEVVVKGNTMYASLDVWCAETSMH